MHEQDAQTDLTNRLTRIVPVDDAALAAAQDRQNQLTKPPGALAELEVLGNRLCAIAGVCPPPVPAPALVAVFAADHGVQAARQVSPWPQEVTGQMAANIAAGGAGVSVLSRAAGADVRVIDLGMAEALPDGLGVENRRLRAGTSDLAAGPAMSRDEAIRALLIGWDIADEAVASGHRALVTGEVGIGNTTPAAALVSVFTGLSPEQTTGRGAGADDAMLERKIETIRAGIEVNHASADDPIGALAGVGGFEHAALTGLVLGGAANRVPVVIDGVIGCSAALAATALAPAVPGYLIAGHAGAEPGIRAGLDRLGLRPLLDLGLRLGEGTGAVAALPLIVASARILREMATFADAGVTSEHES